MQFSRTLAVVGVAGLFILGLAALPTAEDPPRFSGWSEPANLGSVVNAAGDWQTAYDACPTIAKSGLSLYFRSNRSGGEGSFDVYVTQRASLEDPWEAPINLGPTINTQYGEYCTSFSPDGHWMVFVSDRPVAAGGCGGQDLWLSHRKDNRDDLGWETPRNMGCVVNSSSAENGPAWFEDETAGRTLLYFSSNRSGSLGALDIFVSEAIGDEKGDFGPPSPVAELNTTDADYQPVLRRDGLEIFFASNRPGSIPYVDTDGTTYTFPDIWTATRTSTQDPWSTPVNLGPGVNSNEYEFHPTLSFDGTTLIFASERGGPAAGWGDLWVATRSRLRGRR